MVNDPFRNYDAWKTQTPPWYDDEHHSACPCAEDAEPIYSECDGEGKCVCYPDTVIGRLKKRISDWLDVYNYNEIICQPITEPDCKCAELDDDDKASYCDDLEARREER